MDGVLRSTNIKEAIKLYQSVSFKTELRTGTECDYFKTVNCRKESSEKITSKKVSSISAMENAILDRTTSRQTNMKEKGHTLNQTGTCTQAAGLKTDIMGLG